MCAVQTPPDWASGPAKRPKGWPMRDDPTPFGDNLRELRRRARLSQEKLAELAGVSPRTVRNLEAGHVSRPTAGVLRALAHALELSAESAWAFEAAAWEPARMVDAPTPQAPPVRVVPGLLPRSPGDFVGRCDEVETMLDVLATGARTVESAAPMVTLHGRPGVGKTTLALRVAHDLRPEFPDGQLYANLRGTHDHPASTHGVLGRFLAALGACEADVPHDVEERQDRFRSLMAERQILVVLDDASERTPLIDWLPAGERNAVIVTSRAPLALPGAVAVALEVLSDSDGMALLESIVGAERVRAEPDAARDVVESCGRLPLALRVAGSRLALKQHWPIGKLARSLLDDRHVLDELHQGDLDVRASISLTYRRLTAVQQRTFVLMATLVPADVPVRAVAVLTKTSTAHAEAILELLVDAQLIAPASIQSRELHYRMHDLVRAFGREIAAQAAGSPDVSVGQGS